MVFPPNHFLKLRPLKVEWGFINLKFYLFLKYFFSFFKHCWFYAGLE